MKNTTKRRQKEETVKRTTHSHQRSVPSSSSPLSPIWLTPAWPAQSVQVSSWKQWVSQQPVNPIYPLCTWSLQSNLCTLKCVSIKGPWGGWARTHTTCYLQSASHAHGQFSLRAWGKEPESLIHRVSNLFKMLIVEGIKSSSESIPNWKLLQTMGMLPKKARSLYHRW